MLRIELAVPTWDATAVRRLVAWWGAELLTPSATTRDLIRLEVRGWAVRPGRPASPS